MTRTEKLLAELIALPSVNPAFVPPPPAASARQARSSHPFAGEKRVADFLASFAARAGLDVEFQKVAPGRSNVIARLLPPGKIRQTILLAPHLDTVGAGDSQFVPRRKNGRLYGRGACDTKGSVAAMLTALCELANAKSRPRETEIVFAGLVDEENAQIGSRALVRSSAFRRLGQPAATTDRLKAGLQTAVLAIVGEPTRLQVVTAHKGSLWLQLETRGRAAHGATPQLGQNAIYEMARIVAALETDYAARLRKRRHPLLGTATVNVGTISGGAQPNIVPDGCAITIDRRTLPGETEAGVRREIAALLRARKIIGKNFQQEARALPATGNQSEAAVGPAFFAEHRPDAACGRGFLLRRGGVVSRRHSERGVRTRRHRAGAHGGRVDFAGGAGAREKPAAEFYEIIALKPRV